MHFKNIHCSTGLIFALVHHGWFWELPEMSINKLKAQMDFLAATSGSTIYVTIDVKVVTVVTHL